MVEGKEKEIKGRREEVGEVHTRRKRGRREKREEKMKLFKPGICTTKCGGKG